MEPDEVTSPKEGKRRTKVPPEKLVAGLEDDEYRAALQSILATAAEAGLFLGPGRTGFSVRCRASGRPTPISVAWFFPPGMGGWYSLWDLTLGRERSPSVPWTETHDAILRAFSESAAAIPGAERVPTAGVDGFRFRPEAVKAQVEAISALLQRVAEELVRVG
jgi:hypothetical protein